MPLDSQLARFTSSYSLLKLLPLDVITKNALYQIFRDKGYIRFLNSHETINL